MSYDRVKFEWFWSAHKMFSYFEISITVHIHCAWFKTLMTVQNVNWGSKVGPDPKSNWTQRAGGSGQRRVCILRNVYFILCRSLLRWCQNNQICSFPPSLSLSPSLPPSLSFSLVSTRRGLNYWRDSFAWICCFQVGY